MLTLDYGFHITNLRAVRLRVVEHNTAGIRAYEEAGFKPVGRLRRSGTGSALNATRSSWMLSATSSPDHPRFANWSKRTEPAA